MSESNCSIPGSRTFKEFYLDDSLVGHLFLRPSIFVGNSYKWVFSKLETNGCDAVIEVITRIVLFIILPIIALLSVFGVPIGLICKGLHSLCAPPILRKGPEVTYIPTPPVTPIVNKKPLSPPPIPPVIVKTKDPIDLGLLKEIEAAEKLLASAENVLQDISWSKINIATVNEANKLLESKAIKVLLCISPPKNEPSHPLHSFSAHYCLIKGKIRSFEFRYDFYSQTMSADGEIKVSDNGDCLFASFAVGENEEFIQDLRKQAVEWIQANYRDETTLQGYLLNSLAEHYQVKIEKLEREQEEIKTLLSGNFDIEPQQIKDGYKRLQAIPAERQQLEAEIIPKIYSAYGAVNGGIEFAAVESIVPLYLKEMSQKGVYGGTGELYALSSLKGECVKIYKKQGSEIEKNPCEVMNPQFESPLTPARHFVHINNHYNAYYPEQAK